MLRRIARVLRIGLFVAALILLLWLPVSFKVTCSISLPEPFRGLVLSCRSGYVRVAWYSPELREVMVVEARVRFEPANRIRWHRRLAWARYGWEDVTNPGEGRSALYIPLWLLAFLCLAWPVAYFILARRRHKRGFPVEPKGGGEAVSPPVSSGAPTGRGNSAQGASPG